MRNLLSAEWFKIKRFWFAKVLLILWIIFLGLQVNGKLNYIDELKTEVETGISDYFGTPLTQYQIEGHQLLIPQLEQELRYPAIIGTTARLSTGYGWFFIILFTAVIGGEDFTRGTLGMILARGVKRITYLLARTLVLWLAVGAALIPITFLSAVVGISIHSRIFEGPISFQGLGDSLLWVFRSWVTFLPFIIVTLFWAVLGRQAGPAMALGIGLHALEILMGILNPIIFFPSAAEIPWIFRWELRTYTATLGYNSGIFLNWGFPILNPDFAVNTYGLESETLLPPSPWRATVFLIGYSVIFFSWMLFIFRRRDLKSGAQEV